MNLFLEILLIILASANLLLTYPVIIGLRQPTTLPLWGLKVVSSAISPFLFLTGILFAFLGWGLNFLPITLMGGLSSILFLIHIIQITRPPLAFMGFEQAFPKQWDEFMSRKEKSKFLRSRYVFLLPDSPEPVFTQNIPFYTIAETNRKLLCDIWQPPKNIPHSGLAFIYLHGSAWAVLDKDFGTRKLFRHLANQGHVIMDIAYRLFPETDLMGMVHDAKHAIAWMRSNAAAYQVNPEKIVIGGGSAGGHIALLAAYTDHSDELMPADLDGEDISVQAVITLYGQTNLKTTFYHTCQHLITHSSLTQKKKGEPGGMPSWIQKRMGKDLHRLGFDKKVEPGMLTPMLGGSPAEKPGKYAQFSPLTYVHKGCTPTLIIHGKQDILAPVKAIQKLYFRLLEERVPVVMHLIPQTDHAFDLILPKISPSAQNAIYDVERFLALMVNYKNVKSRNEKVYKTADMEVVV